MELAPELLGGQLAGVEHASAQTQHTRDVADPRQFTEVRLHHHAELLRVRSKHVQFLSRARITHDEPRLEIEVGAAQSIEVVGHLRQPPRCALGKMGCALHDGHDLVP
jgi:hypothetical protein